MECLGLSFQQREWLAKPNWRENPRTRLTDTDMTGLGQLLQIGTSWSLIWNHVLLGCPDIETSWKASLNLTSDKTQPISQFERGCSQWSADSQLRPETLTWLDWPIELIFSADYNMCQGMFSISQTYRTCFCRLERAVHNEVRLLRIPDWSWRPVRLTWLEFYLRISNMQISNIPFLFGDIKYTTQISNIKYQISNIKISNYDTRWVEALNNNYHSQCFNCSVGFLSIWYYI